MKQQTAQEKYDTWERTINLQLKKLKEKLEEHSKFQKDDPKDWGFVGDLAHISSELDNTLRMLRIRDKIVS